MASPNFSYFIKLQYLGYRYHGWAKQTGYKTVHGMVDKTLSFVLPKDSSTKSITSSRTDAMVSAQETIIELQTSKAIPENFLVEFNRNLPSDIKALNILNNEEFRNIIQGHKNKTYHYYFAHGKKHHPFAASIMSLFTEHLDIDLMQEGAQLFLGTHDFYRFATKPNEKTITERTITQSAIEINTTLKANFFPETSYVFKISSTGFMRNQVRLIMGQLLELGRKNITLEDLKDSISGTNKEPLQQIAPSSGLVLHCSEMD